MIIISFILIGVFKLTGITCDTALGTVLPLVLVCVCDLYLASLILKSIETALVNCLHFLLGSIGILLILSSEYFLATADYFSTKQVGAIEFYIGPCIILEDMLAIYETCHIILSIFILYISQYFLAIH